MKKKVIIICCLLLIGCSNVNEPDNTTTEQNNVNEKEAVNEEVKEKIGIWYAGMIDDEPIHMQFSMFENRAIGKYYFDEDGIEILIRGPIQGDSIAFVGDDGSILFISNEDHQFYGVYKNNGEIKTINASKENIDVPNTPLITEETLRLEGVYTGLTSEQFSGSSLLVKPLFNHLIYVEMNANNGSRTGYHEFIALKAGDVWKALNDEVSIELTFTQQHEIILNSSDYTFNCGEAVVFDDHYSESFRPMKLDGITLGIAETETEIMFLKVLLGDDYERLISVAQHLIVSEEEGYLIKDYGLLGMPNVVRIAVKNGHYYVVLKGVLYNGGTTHVYTNDFHDMPSFIDKWSGNDRIITRSVLTKSGFKVPIESDNLTSFIPSGYSVKDQIKGDVNIDDYEDIVLVLDPVEQDLESITRVLLILLGREDGYTVSVVTDQAMLNYDDGGVFGDPYDSIELVDHKLTVNFYGGSNYRWAYGYTYDCLYDYKLISHDVMTYLSLALDIERIHYDLITNEVIRTIESPSAEVSSLHLKASKEDLYLETFNIQEGINYEYK